MNEQAASPLSFGHALATREGGNPGFAKTL
jgi:hypothetical protein